MPAVAAREPPRVVAGDNLAVMRATIADASVDLVYLDPPFLTQRDHAKLGGVRVPRAARAPAFGDRWRFDAAAEADLDALAASSEGARRAARALAELLGRTKELAYLASIGLRIAEARRVLSPRGNLVVHTDPTTSHWLRVVLDGVFGPRCFRNEIVWRYRRWPARSRSLQRMHDVLSWYSRSAQGEHFFETLHGYEALAPSTRKTFGTKRQRADFSGGHRKPATSDDDSPGPPLSDVWDVSVLAPIARERTGWPTQKPEALLERVIRALAPPGGVVLDPYCGSGTTLVVAEKLGRRTIGIDVSNEAIAITKSRLSSAIEAASNVRQKLSYPRS